MGKIERNVFSVYQKSGWLGTGERKKMCNGCNSCGKFDHVDSYEESGDVLLPVGVNPEKKAEPETTEPFMPAPWVVEFPRQFASEEENIKLMIPPTNENK